MKIPMMFTAVLLGLLLVQQPVKACGPAQNHPFELSNTNETKELGYPPLLSIVELGARRGMDECQNQFNDSWRLNCSVVRKLVDPQLPVFVNATLPFASRETAFIHAISSAAIAYELTFRCRHNIRECKCVKKGNLNGCGDNFKFGQIQTRRFFENLEKGHGARTAVNLHNNKVGREIVHTSQNRWCKCYGFSSPCSVKKCYQILAPFGEIGSELKQKYHDAVRVWFLDGKLHERMSGQFKAISRKDNRLVYLDPSPNYCVQNDTLGTPGILGRTCTSNKVNIGVCEYFSGLCRYRCKLRVETVGYFKQYNCNCKFVRCLQMRRCQKCTSRTEKYFVTTCLPNQ